MQVSKARSSERKKVAAEGKLLDDDRFSALFNKQDFQIDKERSAPPPPCPPPHHHQESVFQHGGDVRPLEKRFVAGGRALDGGRGRCWTVDWLSGGWLCDDG